MTAGLRTVLGLVAVSHDFKQVICDFLITSPVKWLTEQLSTRVSLFFFSLSVSSLAGADILFLMALAHSPRKRDVQLYFFVEPGKLSPMHG